MQISKGIEVIDTSLWMPEENVLIINDLHIGYEQALRINGILVPKHQLEEIIQIMENILNKIRIKAKTKPNTIIINGDLKHEFGKILKQEWSEVLKFLDFLLKHCKEIIIIQGNHDRIIKPIAEKKGVKVVKEFRMGESLVVHGDQLIETDAKRIIIGHEHPAITIRKGGKYEKYKCFLKGKWHQKELIAVPSFNPLLEGTDVLKEKLLSPFLKDIKKFEAYITNKGEIFNFGKIENLPS